MAEAGLPDPEELEQRRDKAFSRRVVCSSVSILAASRPMFWFSAVLAVIGSVSTVNGFLLVVRLPFLHH